MTRPALAALALLAAPAWADPAWADPDTRVTAERHEGEARSEGAFFHDDAGTEVFAFDRVVPVTVVVRRIDRTPWTDQDLLDAERQLATCEAGHARAPARAVEGPTLTLTFDCVEPGSG